MKYVNFDNNSTTPLYHKIKENIKDFFDIYYNPSSIHSGGNESKQIISICKENILKSLNVNNKEYNIIFTSSGTESNNLTLNSFEKIAISALEHNSISWILNSDKKVEKINIDKDGYVNLNEIENFCKKQERGNFLVSIIYAHHETGIIQKDIKEIAKIVHKYAGIIHSDMSQAYGKLKIDLKDLDIDIITISGHKIYAGYGCSPLVFKNNIRLKPIIFGGMQQDGLRSGTENISAIAFLNEVVKDLNWIINEYQTKVRKIRQEIENEMLKKNESIVIFQNSERLPNCFMIANKNIPTDKQIAFYDIQGILVGHGSACKSNILEKKTILDELKVDQIYRGKEIRISLGIYSQKKDQKNLTIKENKE